MTRESSLLIFAKTLAGKYSNSDQARKNPKDFAHINIYFRPILWSSLKGPWFYSEQSYDYSPWSPYRQGVHQLLKVKDIFVVKNYGIKSPERIAGSGFMPELLNDINKNLFFKRSGCSMHFKEVSQGNFAGRLEPGKECLIKKDDKITYLVSSVDLSQHHLITLDQGFDVNTNKKIWGSQSGPLEFKKVEDLSNLFVGEWLDIK